MNYPKLNISNFFNTLGEIWSFYMPDSVDLTVWYKNWPIFAMFIEVKERKRGKVSHKMFSYIKTWDGTIELSILPFQVQLYLRLFRKLNKCSNI